MRYPIALMLLMLADAISTVGMLRLGIATEANPLMDWAIGISTFGFLVGKGVVGLLAGFALATCPRASFARKALLLVMVGLILWHIVGWVVT